MSEPALPDASAVSPFASVDEGTLLPGQDRLTPLEAEPLFANRRGRLVVWIGERESGKTTLSTQFYERQRNPNAGACFTGSSTLLGFEQLAHPMRAASGRIRPVTRRTEQDPEHRELLHLGVRHGAISTEVVFADLPGEIFRQLADNQVGVSDIPLLARADKAAIVVDGEALASVSKRSMAALRTRQFLERLRSDLSPHTELGLLVTKWDKVEQSEGAAENWLAKEPGILDELRDIDADARSWRVAARPVPGYGASDGMDELMDWLVAPTRYAEDPPLPPYQDTQGVRHPRRVRLR